jgi:hypothetical protein
VTAKKRGPTRVPSERSIMVSLEEPRPLLDEGTYLAFCTDATVAWSRRWRKWIVRLVMEPIDYAGRPYTGSLCKFLSLGTNPKQPHAGQQSRFRELWVEVNGEQPTSNEVELGIFVGHNFRVRVATVKADRNGMQISPPNWYSVIREISFLSEHAIQQHSNTPTHEHSNTRTLQHTNLPTL